MKKLSDSEVYKLFNLTSDEVVKIVKENVHK